MVGSGWFNFGSLVFGLIAWILPGILLLRHQKADPGTVVVFSVASVSACAISLCLQIFSLSHLADIEDWSALMDITPSLRVVAALLLIVTLILNAITLVVYFGKKPED